MTHVGCIILSAGIHQLALHQVVMCRRVSFSEELVLMGGNRRVEKGLFGVNVGLNLMMMVRATIDIISETSSLVPRHFFLLLQVPRRRDSLVIVLRRWIF